ncbi:MAG TPA: hypothetical protein VLJ61_05420 [Pyrinomonadaceae bacterium]|nr:hypothetical protein [Pyrinomonadaceae bacterium]
MPLLKRIEPKRWKIRIDNLNVTPVEVNDKGIKLSVYDNDEHLGELILKNTGVVWQTGKDKKMPEKAFDWINFIKLMEAHRKKGKVASSK